MIPFCVSTTGFYSLFFASFERVSFLKILGPVIDGESDLLGTRTDASQHFGFYGLF
jgi:hypothetical protein